MPKALGKPADSAVVLIIVALTLRVFYLKKGSNQLGNANILWHFYNWFYKQNSEPRKEQDTSEIANIE